MNAIALVSALLLGQCSGGLCPSPSFAPAQSPAHFGGYLGGQAIVGEPIFIDAGPFVVRPAPKPAPRREYRWHAITHEGLTFKVWGYADAGKVTWEPDLPENRRNWEGARRDARLRASQKGSIGSDGSLDVFPKPEPPKAPARPAADDRPAPEAPVKQAIGRTLNFGLAPDRIGRKAEYTAGTPEAKRFVEEAKAQSGEVGRLHVTVIGSADDCAAVVRDLRTDPAFASLRDRLMIQDYRPDEWAVDPKLGYQTHGKPAILVQQAKGPGDPNGGRVLYRAMDYAMGAEGLAEAIRKADPGYHPDRDPGPAAGRHATCPLGFTADHWPMILAVGIVLAIVTVRPSRKEPQP